MRSLVTSLPNRRGFVVGAAATSAAAALGLPWPVKAGPLGNAAVGTAARLLAATAVAPPVVSDLSTESEYAKWLEKTAKPRLIADAPPMTNGDQDLP